MTTINLYSRVSYALLGLLIWLSLPSYALDTIKLYPEIDKKDHGRQHYFYSLLEKALTASQDRYGEFEIQYTDVTMSRERQFLEICTDDGRLNVTLSPPHKVTQHNALRIPFPTLKGLASFRFFYVHEKNQHLLKEVKNLEDLKQFKQGQGRHWSSRAVFEHHNIPVIVGETHRNLISMLMADRFDLLMRGGNEIGLELPRLQQAGHPLHLDEHVLLYMYLPHYFYVSPSEPRLAERIEYGLNKLKDSGEFEKHFRAYYGDTLATYSIKNRVILHIKNTNFREDYYKQDQENLLTFSAFTQ